MSAVISRPGRTTDSNSVYGCFHCMQMRAVFREAECFLLLPHYSQKAKVATNGFLEMPQRMALTCFDEYFAVISKYFEMSWSQIIITKYGCTKQAVRWTTQVQHFFFNAMKSTWDLFIVPFAFLHHAGFFLLYNSSLLIFNVTPGKVGALDEICWHPYSSLIHWNLHLDSYCALSPNYLSLLSCS